MWTFADVSYGICHNTRGRAKIAAGGGKITLVLLSAPDGMEYYPRVQTRSIHGLRRTWKMLRRKKK